MHDLNFNIVTLQYLYCLPKACSEQNIDNKYLIKMNYKVSVVTPFHNVDMDMFADCKKSVMNQTIGFENIEWIIVVHNCKPGYLESLTEMFAGCDNVVIKELNNEARTPSSPRNYGTTFATAPYISYLDGDDSYTDNSLEVTVREAAETQSDIVWFRREVAKEDPNMIMPMATTLWNNTQKRIIVEKDNWDDEKMFSGLFGFATSYLYRLDFLRANQLTFSEEMHFGEDFLFVVETCSKAQRICYLPQHIGYHYFVNGNSMVQNGSKTAEMIIKYAEGFRDLFTTMRNYGIDAQENAQIQCGIIIARFILESPQLTTEERSKIKEILGRDVSSMYLLPANKNFDAPSREMMLRMSQDVILNPENPGEMVLRMMLNGISEMYRILQDNADTDFGRRYNFKGINSILAFQYRIPLTDAKYYKSLVQLQTRVGEKWIFAAEPIHRYFQTATGDLVPSTPSHSRKFAECFSSLLKGKKNMLIARSMPIISKTNDNAEIDTLSSAIAKDYFSQFFYIGGMQQAELSSPISTYFKQDNEPDNYRDLIADALMNTEIEQIVSINTEELLKAFTLLENNWQSILEQLPAGERKDEVKRILSEGFDTPIVKRLWPKVERIIAFGAGELYESFNALKRYTEGIPHNHGYYFTEETIFGKAVSDDSNMFECIQNYNVYELLPVAAKKENESLLWSDVTIGNSYFIVVTNHAGLYRYKTTHIVIPCEITPASIKFTIY